MVLVGSDALSIGATIIDMSEWPSRVPATDCMIWTSQNFPPMRFPGFLRGILPDSHDPHNLVSAESIVIHEEDFQTDAFDVKRADIETKCLVEYRHESVSFDGGFPLVLSFTIVELVHLYVGAWEEGGKRGEKREGIGRDEGGRKRGGKREGRREEGGKRGGREEGGRKRGGRKRGGRKSGGREEGGEGMKEPTSAVIHKHF